MVCTIAENAPLNRLSLDLGVGLQCHSLRKHCVKALERREGDFFMGIPGAALGYCQALFQRSGNAYEHTINVARYLSEINAPWSRSHEMFLGYQGNQSVEEFVRDGTSSLRSGGRMPILITGLNACTDKATIEDITSIDLGVFEGETSLVRFVLDGKDSIDATVGIISKLVQDAEASQQMPKWWPLLQGNLDIKEWQYLQKELGSLWNYINIAVNPYADISVYESILNQVTVAQVAIGDAANIHQDGTIILPEGMVLTGAKPSASYNIYDYFQSLSSMKDAPTVIVLGPSMPGWSVDQNKHRISKLIPLLKDSVSNTLWSELSGDARKEVWSLVA